MTWSKCICVVIKLTITLFYREDSRRNDPKTQSVTQTSESYRFGMGDTGGDPYQDNVKILRIKGIRRWWKHKQLMVYQAPIT